MASYALLAALSGFRYSAVSRTLWFGPQLNFRPFKTFFSTATGFGTISLQERSLRIEVLEGELPIVKLVLTEHAQTREHEWKTTVRPHQPASMNL